MGPGTAPADRGPTFGTPAGSSQMMLPPPAPTSARSMKGTLNAYPPPLLSRLPVDMEDATSNSAVKCGSPPSTKEAFAVVPPISKVITFLRSSCCAKSAEAMTQAEGPVFQIDVGSLDSDSLSN